MSPTETTGQTENERFSSRVSLACQNLEPSRAIIAQIGESFPNAISSEVVTDITRTLESIQTYLEALRSNNTRSESQGLVSYGEG